MKTHADKPTCESLLTILWLFILLSGEEARAGEIPIRIPAQRIDAEPGGKVALSFNGNIQAFLRTATGDAVAPGEFVGVAKIAEQPPIDVNLSTNGDGLEFTVPAELGQNQKQVNDHKVKVFITTQGTNSVELPGHAILAVYPLTTPLVNQINEVAADRSAYVQADESFTVKGSGFFAPPDKIRFVVRSENTMDQPAETTSVAHDGTFFTAVFRGSNLPPAGEHFFDVYVWNHHVAQKANGIWVEDLKQKNLGLAASLALLPVALMVLAVFGLSRYVIQNKRDEDRSPTGQFKPTRLIETLLIDTSTNTYSLARLQFAAWLTVLVYSYGFVFVMRGLVASKWSFPELSGAEMAFLISLGTLVGSVATTSVVGPKGSGDLKPRPRDLIVHGGVLAFDRVQQLVWTFVAMAIFLTIVHHTRGTTESLPEIPNDLLKLMGLSSLGYLAGKAVPKPGPSIKTVTPEGGGLHVQGMNLSMHARVLIDGKEVTPDPAQFEKEKTREMRDVIVIHGTYDRSKIKVTVINPDGQEANWAESASPDS